MSKHVCGSNVRDPKNRSNKTCVCGGHSAKDKRQPPKAKARP